MADMRQEIDRIVDQWVDEVLKGILSSDQPFKKAGLWDRFKKGVSNLFYGYDKKDNPYYWQNRLGQLGVEESNNKPLFLTLSEYSEMRAVLDGAEELLIEAENDTEKLGIVKIIRGAAQRLKELLYGALSKLSPSSKEIPASPVPASVPEKSTAQPSGVRPIKPEPSEAPAPVAAQINSRSHASRAKGWFEEAIKAKQENSSSMKPAKEWLGGEGVIKPEKIPFVLAWMSLRTDKTDDAHIVNALRTDLGDNTIELLPKGARNIGLQKYLKQRWMSEESLSDNLSKLGIKIGESKPENKAKEPEKTKTTEPEKSKPETKNTKEIEPTNSETEKATEPEKSEDDQKNEPEFEKGSEEEIISRLYAQDGRRLDKSEVLKKTREELIDRLLDGLKDERAPQGAHERLLRWWRDNYEQSNDMDIVSELKSGNFLSSILNTIWPVPESGQDRIKKHEMITDRNRKSILNGLKERI
jgi:hypothetical protein